MGVYVWGTGCGASELVGRGFSREDITAFVDSNPDAAAFLGRPVLKPGFFPDSLGGLEETFCFVSLDVDYEAATLEGLRYFWPRLSSGGYLMLHDWGNPALPGPGKALERYEAETGARLPAVPIPDLNGTLVLCK